MNKSDIINHDRNKHIRFTENVHEYHFFPSGDQRKTTESKQFYGVTSWMKNYLPHFDAKAQAVKSSKNPYSEWHGMEPEEILLAWRAKTNKGSNIHKAIENCVNDGLIDEEFENYIDATFELLEAEGLKPLYAEWVIYDEDIERASAIDIVCSDEDGKIVPVDIKVYDNGLTWDGYGGDTFSYPLNDLPASKFDKVSLQTSIYRTILRKKYSDVPLSDEGYVLLFTEEGPELLPTFNYDDYVELMYEYENETPPWEEDE